MDKEEFLLCKQCFVCEREEGFNGSYNTSINLPFKGLCSCLPGQLGFSCDNYYALIQRQYFPYIFVVVIICICYYTVKI